MDVASEIAKDAALEEVYMRLVMACYGIVNVFGEYWGSDFASKILSIGIMITHVFWLISELSPPLKKKLFPVQRPSGLKRADWNFFFHIYKKKIFLLSPPPCTF